MEILRQEERKAGQSYQCDSCDLAIEKGEVHLFTKQTDGDIIHTIRSHVDCYNGAYIIWAQSGVPGEDVPKVTDMDSDDIAVIAEHDEELAQRLADRLGILD